MAEVTCGDCWEPLDAGAPIYWMNLPVNSRGGITMAKVILCEPCGVKVTGRPMHCTGLPARSASIKPCAPDAIAPRAGPP